MCREKNCKCERKIKKIEEDLAALRNLFVGGDLYVNGNIIVRGVIANPYGGVPTLGSGSNIPSSCSAVAGAQVFNINQANPCVSISQGAAVTGASTAFYGTQTPNGSYTFINNSTVYQFNLYNVATGVVTQLATFTSSVVTITNGAITNIVATAL